MPSSKSCTCPGQLGSMRGVLLCLNREGLQLPHQMHRRGLGTQIVWRHPSYEVVYQVLTIGSTLGCAAMVFDGRQQRYGGRPCPRSRCVMMA